MVKTGETGMSPAVGGGVPDAPRTPRRRNPPRQPAVWPPFLKGFPYKK